MQALGLRMGLGPGLGPMPVFAKNPPSLRPPLTPPSTNLPPAFPSLRRTRNTESLGTTRFFLTASFSLSSSSSSSSSGGGAYVEEPATKVKFQTSLSFPGCSSPLKLIGAGYREKVFGIIGVKVYAAALYTNQSISSILTAWKGRSVADVEKDDLLFKSIFEAPSEKSLQIILVRDIDGKTFWDALDDAIAPRIKAPTVEDEYALSMFRSIFQGKPLKKGTSIFLTWPDPSKMMVSVSSNGLPSDVAATIGSANASSALFDVFFGNAPVSPSLKGSVASGLASMLK